MLSTVFWLYGTQLTIPSAHELISESGLSNWTNVQFWTNFFDYVFLISSLNFTAHVWWLDSETRVENSYTMQI